MTQYQAKYAGDIQWRDALMVPSWVKGALIYDDMTIVSRCAPDGTLIRAWRIKPEPVWRWEYRERNANTWHPVEDTKELQALNTLGSSNPMQGSIVSGLSRLYRWIEG